MTAQRGLPLAKEHRAEHVGQLWDWAIPSTCTTPAGPDTEALHGWQCWSGLPLNQTWDEEAGLDGLWNAGYTVGNEKRAQKVPCEFPACTTACTLAPAALRFCTVLLGPPIQHSGRTAAPTKP